MTYKDLIELINRLEAAGLITETDKPHFTVGRGVTGRNIEGYTINANGIWFHLEGVERKD